MNTAWAVAWIVWLAVTAASFGVTNDGRAYAVAADLAKRFDYTSAKDALRLLDEDEKGRQILPTPGGSQEMLVVYLRHTQG